MTSGFGQKTFKSASFIQSLSFDLASAPLNQVDDTVGGKDGLGSCFDDLNETVGRDAFQLYDFCRAKYRYNYNDII